MLTTLAGVIVVLMLLVPQISSLLKTVKDLFDLRLPLLWTVC